MTKTTQLPREPNSTRMSGVS